MNEGSLPRIDFHTDELLNAVIIVDDQDPFDDGYHGP
jgi:hypothetical protein